MRNFVDFVGKGGGDIHDCANSINSSMILAGLFVQSCCRTLRGCVNGNEYGQKLVYIRRWVAPYAGA